MEYVGLRREEWCHNNQLQNAVPNARRAADRCIFRSLAWLCASDYSRNL